MIDFVLSNIRLQHSAVVKVENCILFWFYPEPKFNRIFEYKVFLKN